MRRLNFSPGVRRQIQIVAAGDGILTAAMLLLTAVCRRMSLPVAAGALTGALLALANFLFTARAVEQAAAAPQDAGTILKRSYHKRMAGVMAVLAAGIALGWLWWPTAVLPLAFPKLSLSLGRAVLRQADPKGDG